MQWCFEIIFDWTRYFLILTGCIASLLCCPIVLRLLDFDVGTPTGLLVLLPPAVRRARSSVHGPLQQAKVRSPGPAWPITLPNMLSVHIYLIMKGMVHLKQTWQLTEILTVTCFMLPKFSTWKNISKGGKLKVTPHSSCILDLCAVSLNPLVHDKFLNVYFSMHPLPFGQLKTFHTSKYVVSKSIFTHTKYFHSLFHFC